MMKQTAGGHVLNIMFPEPEKAECTFQNALGINVHITFFRENCYFLILDGCINWTCDFKYPSGENIVL